MARLSRRRRPTPPQHRKRRQPRQPRWWPRQSPPQKKLGGPGSHGTRRTRRTRLGAGAVGGGRRGSGIGTTATAATVHGAATTARSSASIERRRPIASRTEAKAKPARCRAREKGSSRQQVLASVLSASLLIAIVTGSIASALRGQHGGNCAPSLKRRQSLHAAIVGQRRRGGGGRSVTHCTFELRIRARQRLTCE